MDFRRTAVIRDYEIIDDFDEGASECSDGRSDEHSEKLEKMPEATNDLDAEYESCWWNDDNRFISKAEAVESDVNLLTGAPHSQSSHRESTLRRRRNLPRSKSSHFFSGYGRATSTAPLRAFAKSLKKDRTRARSEVRHHSVPSAALNAEWASRAKSEAAVSKSAKSAFALFSFRASAVYSRVMRSHPILARLPPFIMFRSFCFLIDAILITSVTTTRFLLLWALPFALILLWSATCSVIVFVIVYPSIYRLIVPYRYLLYPIYFDYHPLPQLLREPYVSFGQPDSALLFDPAGPANTQFAARNTPVAVHLLNWFSKSYRRRQQKAAQPGAVESSSDFSRPHVCPTCHQEHRAPSFNNSSKTHDWELFLRDEVGEPTDVAVALFTFDNKTWDYGQFGIEPRQLCFWYYDLMEKNREEEARVILKSLLEKKNFHSPRRFGRRSTRSRKPSSHGVDIRRPYNVWLSIEYSAYEFFPGPVSAEYRPTTAARRDDQRPLSQRFPEYRGSGSAFVPTSFTIMLTVELFNWNCTPVVRATRPHILYGFKRGVVAKLLRLFSKNLWSRETDRIERSKILFFSNFRFLSDFDVYLSRVRLSPTIPLISAHVHLEPIYGGFRLFFANHALITYTAVFTASVNDYDICHDLVHL